MRQILVGCVGMVLFIIGGCLYDPHVASTVWPTGTLIWLGLTIIALSNYVPNRSRYY